MQDNKQGLCVNPVDNYVSRFRVNPPEPKGSSPNYVSLNNFGSQQPQQGNVPPQFFHWKYNEALHNKIFFADPNNTQGADRPGYTFVSDNYMRGQHPNAVEASDNQHAQSLQYSPLDPRSLENEFVLNNNNLDPVVESMANGKPIKFYPHQNPSNGAHPKNHQHRSQHPLSPQRGYQATGNGTFNGNNYAPMQTEEKLPPQRGKSRSLGSFDMKNREMAPMRQKSASVGVKQTEYQLATLPPLQPTHNIHQTQNLQTQQQQHQQHQQQHAEQPLDLMDVESLPPPRPRGGSLPSVNKLLSSVGLENNIRQRRLSAPADNSGPPRPTFTGRSRASASGPERLMAPNGVSSRFIVSKGSAFTRKQ